jgi:hypothetical protein
VLLIRILRVFTEFISGYATPHRLRTSLCCAVCPGLNLVLKLLKPQLDAASRKHSERKAASHIRQRSKEIVNSIGLKKHILSPCDTVKAYYPNASFAVASEEQWLTSFGQAVPKEGSVASTSPDQFTCISAVPPPFQKWPWALERARTCPFVIYAAIAGLP